MKNKKSKPNYETKVLAIAGLLIAVTVILERFLSIFIPIAGLPALRFGFGGIPAVLMGIIYGPFWGGIVGVVSDLIGVTINTGGAPYFPGFTLSAFLRGFIPGLIFLVIKKNKIKFNFTLLNVFTLLVISFSIVALLFNGKYLVMDNGIIYLAQKPLPLWIMALFIVLVLSFVLISVVIGRKTDNSWSIYSLDKILFAVSLHTILISLILNTLWLSMLYNKGFLIFLPGRVLSALITIPLDTLILYTLLNALKNIISEP